MRKLPSLIALRFFEAAAQHLNFNQAANALCVTQSAVSRQIKILEDSLELALFVRRHDGVQLTDAGKKLLDSLSNAFDIIEDGIQQAKTASSRSQLTVSVPPTFATRWLSPRLHALTSLLPGVDLSILTQPDPGCHCSIRFGREPSRDVSSELLMMEEHVLIGAPSLAGRPLRELLDNLPRLHVLHRGKRLGLWPDWLKAAHVDTVVQREDIDVSTLDQAIQATEAGAALAVVDQHMIADALRKRTLKRMSEVVVTGPYGYWLDVPPRNIQNDNVRVFSQWLRDEAASAARTRRKSGSTR